MTNRLKAKTWVLPVVAVGLALSAWADAKAPRPKGWKQDWSAAKPSKWTPEGGLR